MSASQVQHRMTTVGAGATSVSLAFSGAATVGNRCVAEVCIFTHAHTVSSCTDNGTTPNSYNADASIAQSGGIGDDNAMDLRDAQIATNPSSGNLQVTWTFNTGANGGSVEIQEWSGLATDAGSILDVASTGEQTSGSTTLTAATAANSAAAGEPVLAIFGIGNNATPSAGANTTLDDQNSAADGSAFCHRTANSVGGTTESAVLTTGSTTTYLWLVVVLKLPAGATAGSPTRMPSPISATPGTAQWRAQVRAYYARYRFTPAQQTNVNLSLTAADSITQITEVANRAAMAFIRTAADSITQITETANRLLTSTRTAADSLTQVTEVAVRSAMAFVRTASDSITQISEAAVRAAMAFARTAADSPTQISETAARATMAFVRTASDSITQVTEVANRAVQAFVRTAADSITQITESAAVSGAHNIVRTASDSVTQVSDSAVRALMNSIRAAADSPVQVTEVANRAAMAAVRMAADSVAQVTEVAARLLAKARTSADSITQLTEAAVRRAGAVRVALDSPTGITEIAGRVVHLGRPAAESIAAITDVARNASIVVLSSVITIGRPFVAWSASLVRGWRSGNVTLGWRVDDEE